jgi:hypothetical protein
VTLYGRVNQVGEVDGISKPLTVQSAGSLSGTLVIIAPHFWEELGMCEWVNEQERSA